MFVLLNCKTAEIQNSPEQCSDLTSPVTDLNRKGTPDQVAFMQVKEPNPSIPFIVQTVLGR